MEDGTRKRVGADVTAWIGIVISLVSVAIVLFQTYNSNREWHESDARKVGFSITVTGQEYPETLQFSPGGECGTGGSPRMYSIAKVQVSNGGDGFISDVLLGVPKCFKPVRLNIDGDYEVDESMQWVTIGELPTQPTGGFGYQIPRLGPGDRVEFLLAAPARDDGSQFIPYSTGSDISDVGVLFFSDQWGKRWSFNDGKYNPMQ